MSTRLIPLYAQSVASRGESRGEVFSYQRKSASVPMTILHSIRSFLQQTAWLAWGAIIVALVGGAVVLIKKHFFDEDDPGSISSQLDGIRSAAAKDGFFT